MISWLDKITFVGLEYEIIEKTRKARSGTILHNMKIKLRIPGGVSSFGFGDTIEEAIKDAAIGFPLDWRALETRITGKEWDRIAHQ